MSAPAGQVPDLSAAGRLVIVEWEVIPPNAVDIFPGAMGNPDATHHLRVLDLLRRRAILCPLEPKQLRALLERLQTVPEANASRTTQPPRNGARKEQTP